MAGRTFDPASVVAALPQPEQGGSYLLALSGGLDSAALLHVLCNGTLSAPLRALHVHHGLLPAADGWALHCEKLCHSLDVPFAVARVTPALGPRRSIEAEARTSRYAALKSAMRPGDVLLTAHHMDDQAETLFLQLLRGSGVRGLAAMAATRAFGPGLHVRPLLDVPRTLIEAYARSHGLTWVEDPSNADNRFARSRLRRQIMPLVSEGWPEAIEMFSRTARHCAEAAEILDQMGADDLAACKGGYEESLSIPPLQGLSAARRRNALRVWFENRGLPLPTAAHMRRIETEVLGAAVDATPLLAWPGVEVRRYRDQLFAIAPLPDVPEAGEWNWQLGDQLDLAPGCGRLQAELVPDRGLRAPLPGERVQVRLSRGGERVRLQDRIHHHELKQLQQRAGIPPWVRRRLPLVYYGEQVAAIADLWICHGYEAEIGESGYALRWQATPPGYPPLNAVV